MFRFTTRDVLWLMVVVGLSVALWKDRQLITRLDAQIESQKLQSTARGPAPPSIAPRLPTVPQPPPRSAQSPALPSQPARLRQEKPTPLKLKVPIEESWVKFIKGNKEAARPAARELLANPE